MRITLGTFSYLPDLTDDEIALQLRYAIGNDWAMANRVLPKALAAAKASWQTKTTWDNLLLLKSARERAGQSPAELDDILRYLEQRYNELSGEEKKAAAS